jgi:hypothetical protein
MNYLQLCQDLMREAGMTGSIASVQNQVGEAQRVVNWIAKAYRSVQLEHAEWEFLRAAVLFDTTSGSNTYTAASAGVAGLGSWRWHGNDWRAYHKSIGPMDEQPLAFVDYDNFRRIYAYSAQRLTQGRPTVITECPDQSLLMWPIPSDDYVIVGEMHKAPSELVLDIDTPAFEPRFHDIIVYRALMLYGAFEGDSAVFTQGQAEAARILAQMEDKYLPKWQDNGPMA